MNSSSVAVYHLECNDLDYPKGIPTREVTFSWKVRGLLPKTGICQSAYQIVVEDSAGNCVFDTGKIREPARRFYRHVLPLLESSRKYSYQVKIWDEQDAESGFSQKSYFITGLLECPKTEDYDWGFLGDWAYCKGNDERGSRKSEFFSTFAAIYAIAQTVRLGEALGETEKIRGYPSILETMRQTVHQTYYREESGQYLGGQQRYAAIALCAGVVPEQERQRVEAGLVRSLNEKGYMDGGSAGTVFIYRILETIPGGREALYAWLERTDCPSYGYFIRNGHNTMPEVWDIGDFAGGSRIHTCFSGIAGWYLRSLLGITPDKASCRRFHLAPFLPGDMETLESSVDYGFGPLEVSWKKQEEKVSLELFVPVSMEIYLHIPQEYAPQEGSPRHLVLKSGSFSFLWKKELSS